MSITSIAVSHVKIGYKMSEVKKEKFSYYAPEPFFLEIFKNGVIHISAAFYSHITYENWSKNEQAMQKSKKPYIYMCLRLIF